MKAVLRKLLRRYGTRIYATELALSRGDDGADEFVLTKNSTILVR